MRPVPRIVRCLTLMVPFLGIPSVVALELPPEAKTLVEEYQRDIEAAKKSYAEQVKAWRARVIGKLKTVQHTLAVAENLEDAIRVRDWIKQFEAGPTARKTTLTDEQLAILPRNLRESVDLSKGIDAAAPIPRVFILRLPKEAQLILVEDEHPGEEARHVEAALRGKTVTLRKKLAELQATLVMSEKLDEAVAVRDWARTQLQIDIGPNPSPIAPAEAPATIKDIAAGAKDLAEIHRNYQMALAEAGHRLQRGQTEPLKRLLESLKSLQSAAAKSGKLDDALVLRDLLRSLEGQPTTSQVSRLMLARQQLPKEASQAVESFSSEIKPLTDEWQRTVANLSEQLQKPLKERAKKELMAGKLEEARQTLIQLYTQRNERFPYSVPHHLHPVTVSEEMQKLLEAFSDETKRRLETADVAEAAAREALLKMLREAQERNLKADEELALERTIAYLESAANRGLRGLLLFPRDPRLKGDLAEAVASFARKFRQESLALEEQHRQAFSELRPQFARIMQAHADAEDWRMAFATLLAQREPPPMFEPIPIKYYRHPHSRGIDGVVLETRDGLFRVRNAHNQDSWGVREEITVGDERRPAESNGDPPTPGVAVTLRTKLREGQLALTKRVGWSWDVVEIVEPGIDSAKVRYTDRHGWEEVISRSNLRIIPED